MSEGTFDKYQDIIEVLAKELHKISHDWELKDGTKPDAVFTNTKYSVADFFINTKGEIGSDLENSDKKDISKLIEFTAQELALIANACRKIEALGKDKNV